MAQEIAAKTPRLSNPFGKYPPPKQAFIARVFRRPHADGLIWAVETELASRPEWWAIEAERLRSIEALHRTTLAKAGSRPLALIEKAANGLPDAEWLAHGPDVVRELAGRLARPEIAQPAIDSRSRRLVAQAVETAIADDRLTDDEMRALDRLAEQVKVAPAVLTEILTQEVSRRMQREITAVLADGMLSDVEERRLETLADGLRVKLDLADDAKAILREARISWQIEEGELPVVPAPINLQRGEVCHFEGHGEVLEMRQRTVRTSVRGGSVRIRIAKGVYYNMGSYKAQPHKESFHHSFGQGEIVITNKRLLFNGGEKNFAIRLSGIVDFTPFTDGIEVRRGSGKPLTFVLDRTDKNFSRIFGRALQDA